MCRNYITNNVLGTVKGSLIVALLMSDMLMRRAFFVLQPYLTNVWKLSFTHAAAIVNIWEGTSLMLPAVFQFLADKYAGNFKVVVICSIASTLGLGLVTMSLPPVLGSSPCKQYEKKCIDNEQRALLYMGVVLTAIGRAGVNVCVPPLHDEQDQVCCIGPLQMFGGTKLYFVLSVIAALIISVIPSWTLRFGFPAIFATYVTLIFLGGWKMYNKGGPKHQGSLLGTVLKVFTRPRPTAQSHGATNRTIREDQQAATLEEYDFIRHITFISITYIILGIVSALGSTFFVEQANHMNRKLLFMNVPLAAFQLPMLVGTIIAWPTFCAICSFMSIVDDYCGDCIPECLRIIPSFLGTVTSMVNAILGCVIAAVVEKRRLHIWKGINDPELDIVPMHATWLVFQFYIVGCVDLFFRSNIEAYYHALAPGSLKDRHVIYKDFVSGLGFVSSVILVAIVGKITETNGKAEEAWFQNSVNTSHLDRYYWLLAVLSSMSLVAFCLMAVLFCLCKNVKQAEVDRPGDQRRGDGDGEKSMCCFRR